MKSFLQVLSNILCLGIPLIIRALSKARKFDQIVNERVLVVVNHRTNAVELTGPYDISITLRIDQVWNDLETEAERTLRNE